MKHPAPDKKRIQYLNDRFRKSFVGGRVLMTSSVQELGRSLDGLIQEVQSYSNFSGGNDPYGEHDFGSLEYQGTRYFWKIDYFDKNMEHQSPDPSSPELTARVMTLMRADEY